MSANGGLTEDEKEARRRKVEEIRRKMNEKGSLSSTSSRTSVSDREQTPSPPSSNNSSSSQSTNSSGGALAHPPAASTAAALDGDVDPEDVERVLEKAARLLRDEEDRSLRKSIRLPPRGSSPLSSASSASLSSSSSSSTSSAPAPSSLPTTSSDATPPTPAPTPVLPIKHEPNNVQQAEAEEVVEGKTKKKKKKKPSPRSGGDSSESTVVDDEAEGSVIDNNGDTKKSPKRDKADAKKKKSSPRTGDDQKKKKKKKDKKRQQEDTTNDHGANGSSGGAEPAQSPRTTGAPPSSEEADTDSMEASVELMMPEATNNDPVVVTPSPASSDATTTDATTTAATDAATTPSSAPNESEVEATSPPPAAASPLTSPSSSGDIPPLAAGASTTPEARQRGNGWQRGNFSPSLSSKADQMRRARAQGNSGSPGSGAAGRAPFLGYRSSEAISSSNGGSASSLSPSEHPALKLFGGSSVVLSDRSSVSDDEAEERMRRIQDRRSVFSTPLSGGPPGEVASPGGVSASLARKWGAARRSGQITSFPDLMRLRSASVALGDPSGLMPGAVAGSHTMTNKNDEYVVKFVYEDDLYRIVCSCEMNPFQIKSAMIQHVRTHLGLGNLPRSDSYESEGDSKSRPSSASNLSSLSSSSSSSSSTTSSPRTSTSSPPPLGQSLDEKDYVLKIPGVNYYLVKEEQSLHLVGVLQVCKKSFVSFPLEMIPRPSTDVLRENDKLNVKDKIMSELNANTEVFELLANPISGDNPLTQILKSDNDEINSFRKRITKVRRAVLRKREEAVSKLAQDHSNSKYDTSFLPQYRESEPLPLNLPNSFIILAYQPANETSTQKFSVTLDMTVDELKTNLFRKYKGTHPQLAVGTEADYIVKVTGFKEYMIGSHKVISYDYIRKCLSKKVTPILSLVPLDEVDLMIPEPVEDSVVDMILSREKNEQMTKLRHKELEARKPVTEMLQQLRVRINSVDNVDTFNNIIKSWMREQKGKKEHGSSSGDKSSHADADKRKKTYCLFVCAQIYHGDELIADDMYTNAILYSNGPLWNEWLVSSIKLCDIPRGARMCFTLYRRQLDGVSAEAVFTEKGKFNEKTDVPLGWVNCQFIDHKDQLRQGLCSFRLWLGRANPIGTCVDNVTTRDPRPTTLHVEFQMHRTTVYFPPPPGELGLGLRSPSSADATTSNAAAATSGDSQQDTSSSSSSSTSSASSTITRRQLEEIMKKGPLTPLSPAEQELLWEHRQLCAQYPPLLPRFLQYVKWNNRDCVREAYRMLAVWSPPTPFEALSLLDAKFASPVVRAYAVRRLHELDDRALSDFLLQLTQVLKYEAYHYSPLAEFLLSRALMNVNQIGHAFFWLLKSELHNPTIASRYSLLAEAYLRGCGSHRQELIKQNKVLNQLAKVALRVKESPSAEKLRVLEDGLRKMEFPSKFLLPLDPRQEVKGVIVEKCKYMDSKKQPLWLVFENADKRGAPIRVIFKAGDDLRQDVLTLQMIRIMDKLWKEDGLDLRLNAYGCVATGDELGMIEVVLNAATTASVNKQRGGSKAVLYKDTLTSWLKEKNPSPEGFEGAQENFMLSCAGYCVATYVLGIGDRHNDNIMMTEFGHLFHIDFGHFLGNVKSKLGIKRERAPFIFNPQFAHVLGGANGARYAQYVETCQRAYNIVRKHAHMFINLFMMMLSTGIPELQSEEDIEYLCNSLMVGSEDKPAAENFAKLIEEARKTKSVLVNDIVHIWAHSKK